MNFLWFADYCDQTVSGCWNRSTGHGANAPSPLDVLKLKPEPCIGASMFAAVVSEADLDRALTIETMGSADRKGASTPVRADAAGNHRAAMP
jgi:hypothetical protein